VVCAVHGLVLYPPLYDTSEDGSELGCEDGSELGCEDGSDEGCEEGSELGCEDGSELGCEDGSELGCVAGSELGCAGSEAGCATSDVSEPLFASVHASMRAKGSIIIHLVWDKNIVHDSAF